MESLEDAVAGEAERTGFSGVVRLDRSGETELAHAYGLPTVPTGSRTRSRPCSRPRAGPRA